MTDTCLKCGAPVIYGKVIEKDGKKEREKFDVHVCDKNARKYQREEDRLTQLKRIADSLEKIAEHWESIIGDSNDGKYLRASNH